MKRTLTRNLFSTVFVLGLVCCLGSTLFAQVKGDPFSRDSIDYTQWGPKLIADDIMPNQKQIDAVKEWTELVFANKTPRVPSFDLKLVRQDFNTLKFDESCMGTPLRIGSKSFRKGLGTHANSEIRVSFQEPVTRFTSHVGIDNNFDTQGINGSAQFIVKAGDKELLTSPVLTGKDEPFAVDVQLPEGTKEVILIVSTTGDGPSHDQSDWCEPIVYGKSGKKYELSESKPFSFGIAIPFSFNYGGVSSEELLPKWKFEEKQLDRFRTVYSWTDPETKFKVSATVRLFEKFAAVDWVLNFENGSDKDSKLLKDVRTTNMKFAAIGIDDQPVVINTLTGDFCDKNSWLPVKHPLKPGENKAFKPQGGRPSNGTFPFWNLQRCELGDDDPSSSGVFISLGWSGQWNADFRRASRVDVEFESGMEALSTILYPQESIRTPRVLLMPWNSDRLSAHVLFRRLLMFEYAPQNQAGLPQELYFVGQCFDRYYRKLKDWEKISGQTEYARKLAQVGCTAHWFDAAWFPVGFPNGVGNWFSDPESFPNGVEELGKTVHKLGMKLILWFEPERVASETQIAKEYPQYVFGGENGGLYKLNDPEARAFLTDLLLKRIKEFGVDVYRNDFNIDPLHFWRQNDAPDRQGITEIRYVEGHYEMWNRFRREVPGLWIDNCASGGRRIDLETTSISIPLWRSDTCCWAGHPEWDQTQTLGLGQYLPIFSCSAWDSSPYTFRSAANMGCITQYNYLDDDYDPELAQASIRESKVYQKFWYGDFYPLSEAKVGETELLAWQLHRSDLEAGLVYLFRQSSCPYIGRELGLRGIDADARYRITIKRDYDSQEKYELSGDELQKFVITFPEKKSAYVLEYAKVR